MVRTAARPSRPEQLRPLWITRFVAGLGLFLATACVVLWQNAHVAILWDTSYVLDSAVRFANGQAPYRHFPFVHPPLTFLVQAAIIRFTGRVFFHHVLYAAAVGGLGTVLTWRLTLESLRGRVSGAWAVALLVAAPLTVLGIYSIIPIPEYDGDCAFWILVALWLLQRADAKKVLRAVLLPELRLCVPLFANRTWDCRFCWRPSERFCSCSHSRSCGAGKLRLSRLRFDALSFLAGACATLFAAALVLHWTVGIRTYVYWTIRFAGERRMPGFGPMLFVFRDPSLLWTLPCVAVGLVLLWLPHPRNRVPHPRRAIVLAPRVGSRFRWTQIAPSPCWPRRFSSRLPRCSSTTMPTSAATACSRFGRCCSCLLPPWPS
jgi:hypothetical protein